MDDLSDVDISQWRPSHHHVGWHLGACTVEVAEEVSTIGWTTAGTDNEYPLSSTFTELEISILLEVLVLTVIIPQLNLLHLAPVLNRTKFILGLTHTQFPLVLITPQILRQDILMKWL